MITPRRAGRARICDGYRATGDAHRLGTAPVLLIVDGRTLQFCSVSPCLLSYICNQPYEDCPISAVG